MILARGTRPQLPPQTPNNHFKIDRDFIAAINSSRTVFSGEMIKIGKMMGISVIAEGVGSQPLSSSLSTLR